MGFVLGVDQGGTKTCAAVMDRGGNILSRRLTEGCYFHNEGLLRASRLIFEAIDDSLGSAGLTIDDIDITVAGVTGVDWDEDEAKVKNALFERYGKSETIVCNDCEIAYYSGSVKPVGAVICAGSGVNAAFFAPNGKKFVMGDYFKASSQGGSAIAKRAIEAVFDSDLGAVPHTGLTKLFLGFSNDSSIGELLKKYVTDKDFRRSTIALVPMIVELANEGDEVALSVLTAFSDELCASFIAAMKKMNILELNCDIVLAGGVFEGLTNCLTAMIARELARRAKNALLINAEYAPVVGACIMGHLNKAGDNNECFSKNIAVTAKKTGLTRLSPKLN